MLCRYVHMNGKTLEKPILELNGIKVPEKASGDTMKPAVCPRCKKINPSDARFCSVCGSVFSLKTALEVEAQKGARSKADGILSAILKDPEVKKLVKSGYSCKS